MGWYWYLVAFVAAIVVGAALLSSVGVRTIGMVTQPATATLALG